MTQEDALFNQVNQSVMLRSMQGIINFWNHSAEKLYGWRKEEAIGKVSHDLLQTQFPKPLKEIESELLQKGQWEGKLVHTTRDGGRVVVESRWTLDRAGQPEKVVEINEPAGAAQKESEVGTSANNPATGGDSSLTVANIILAGGAFFGILVSFYFFYNFYRPNAAPYRVTLFGILPAVLAGVLFISLKLRRVRRLQLALVFFSTVATVYAVEFATALLDVWVSLPSVAVRRDMQERARLAKQLGVNFDVRSKFEVAHDLRSKGVDAYPVVPPFGLLLNSLGGQLLTPLLVENQPDVKLKSKIVIEDSEVLPLSGISQKVSVLCNESGEYTIYNSDEYGFHNPPGLWNSGRIDIAALGDSFAHGFCVSSDKNFVAQIRKRYPETLNLAMLGDGPLLMLATLQEYLQTVKPKIVLWFHFEGNDLRDLQIERHSPLLMRYMTGGGFSQDLLHRQPEIDQALAAHLRTIQDQGAPELRDFIEVLTSEHKVAERLLKIIRMTHLRHRLGLMIQSVRTPDPAAKYSDVSKLFTQVLARADESVRGWGGKLYFVYLPEWEPYGNPANADGRREVVLEAVKTLGLPIIDLHPTFQAQKDPLALFPFRVDAHYNEEGHRVVAEEVLRAISKP